MISGWGRNLKIEAEVLHSPSQFPLIPRGSGMSYGDSSLALRVLSSESLHHFYFDPYTGILQSESGVLLKEILERVIPEGWSLPVLPGTSIVTIGGAIASDIHGKNHLHQGCFSEHVNGIQILLGSGEILKISKTQYPDLFHATCAGMGLTGMILSAEIQLQKISSTLLEVEKIKVKTINELCDLFIQHQDSPYTVAWVDGLRGGIFSQAQESTIPKHEFNQSPLFNIPLEMPLINHGSSTLFNALYRDFSQSGSSLVGFEDFHFQLDKIRNWNLLYGPQGFVQCHVVVPREALTPVLALSHSVLSVLKYFGEQNQNLLSFPMKGFSLSLDFRIIDVPKLEELVLYYGGRLYLTKDSQMSSHAFQKCYPRWEEFETIREKYAAIGKFSSLQSKRLGLR